MRNLLLTSNGISTEILKVHLYSILPKKNESCSYAIIVNTTFEESEKIRKSKKRETRANNLGFKHIVRIDLEKDDPKMLNEFDCIEIAGGNPFILLKVIRESNSDSTIREILNKGKIIIGESGSSMIMTPNLNFIKYVDGKLNDIVKLTNLNALNLFPNEIFPHYDTYCQMNPELKILSENYEKDFNVNLLKLKDGQATYNQNNESFII